MVSPAASAVVYLHIPFFSGNLKFVLLLVLCVWIVIDINIPVH